MSEMGIFEVMYSVRAMRRFRPDPVPEEVINKVIEAATRAPSAGNTQSWLFAVITDPERRRKIGEIYSKASQWVRPIYEANPHPEHMSASQYERFWNSGTFLYEHMAEAPVLIMPCLRLRRRVLPETLAADARAALEREYAWSAGASIYPAVQNMLLACRALGLGTVLTTNHMLLETELKDVLGLPEDVKTFGLMPVGYPMGKFGPVVRKPIAEVVLRL